MWKKLLAYEKLFFPSRSVKGGGTEIRVTEKCFDSVHDSWWFQLLITAAVVCTFVPLSRCEIEVVKIPLAAFHLAHNYSGIPRQSFA